MNRRYVYPMAVGLMVCCGSLIYGDEPASATAERCAKEMDTSPAEPGDRSDPSGWYKMFGYPNLDEAEELARITKKPMMIVFR